MEHRSVIPYYYQIKEDLIAKIQKGELKEDEKIPSETLLAAEYGVSRPTVRQAINELVFAGYLWRKQGKGTFVAPFKIQKNLQLYTPLVEELESQGKTLKIKVLSKKSIKATDEVARLLQIEPDEELIELRALRIVNDTPITLRTSYYPAKIVPQLINENIDDTPIYKIIKKYGLTPVKTKDTIQVVQARKKEAKYFEVEEGFPLILWEGVVFLDEGRPFELTKALYRSDKFKFYVEQHREKNSVSIQMKNR